jgi:hypothetical protein
MFQPHCKYTRPIKWKAVPSTTIRRGYALEFVEFNDNVFCVRKDGVNDGVGVMLSFYPKVDVTMVILTN